MDYRERTRMSELRDKAHFRNDSAVMNSRAEETDEILTCEKHGEYPKRVISFTTRPIELTSCPKCVKEETEREEVELKELEAKLQEERDIEEQKLAGVSKRNSRIRFKDFDQSKPEQKRVYDAVYKMARDIYDGNETPNIILTGKVGTGKTMLANCAINSLFKSKNVRIMKLQDMLRKIKGSYSKSATYTEEQAIERYSGFDLLIIDEVGVSRDTDLDKNLIFDVLDGRYQNVLPTMIISNLNIDGIKEILGDRVVDRLRDGGGVLLGCDWESFRK